MYCSLDKNNSAEWYMTPNIVFDSSRLDKQIFKGQICKLIFYFSFRPKHLEVYFLLNINSFVSLSVTAYRKAHNYPLILKNTKINNFQTCIS